MNGRQLAAVATGRWPHLKVLFTTGYTANAIVHHGVLDPGVGGTGVYVARSLIWHVPSS